MSNILIIVKYTLRDEYNELFEGIKQDDDVTLVYVIDFKYLNSISNKRKEFILQALKNFKQDLFSKGIHLNVVESIHGGNFDEIRVEKQYESDEIDFNETFSNRVEINTQTIIDELDSKINLDQYTKFRKDVESLDVYDVKLIEREIPKFNSIKIESVNLECEDIKLRYTPSREIALKHLNEYIWEKELIKTYKETRNQMLGEDFSTKFSPYLSLGILSVKEIISQINLYEFERVKNDSTYWVKFELLWREYCKWVSLKYKNKVFLKTGIAERNIYQSYNEDFYNKFVNSKTGYELVDAGVNELVSTGYISNRVRQNLASFFVKNLHLPWVLGAKFFEYHLLDYNAASNYLNWQYIAGCGSDSREFRYFNIDKQTKTYDKDKIYIKAYNLYNCERVVDFFKTIKIAQEMNK